MNQTKVKHECTACGGTGLYSGMGESAHAAVVCSRCKGQGWQESTFEPFTGRKELPGIKIGEGNGHKLEDFGGMPLADWVAGRPFERGMENRAYTCPRWWEQCTTGPMPEWRECDNCLGSSFSRCSHFGEKAKCWERWDAEQGNRAI